MRLKNHWRIWTQVVFAATCFVLFAVIEHGRWYTTTKLDQASIRVVDSATNQPIARAQLGLLGSKPLGLTDESGLSVIRVRKNVSRPADLTIAADGYRIATVKMDDGFGRVMAVVPLQRINPSRNEINESIATSMVGVSGEGVNWGQQYLFCSKPAPSGYRVAHAKFYLRGDRQCGAWAECSEAEQDESRVCYQFRLQGRGESNGKDSQARAVGILVVTFEKLTTGEAKTSSPPSISSQAVCHFYGEASQGTDAWNRDVACTVPGINSLDIDYHQQGFICCGGGATSRATNSDVPPGLEVRVIGEHYWSVDELRLVGDQFSLHTYCGPEPPPGPGCNVDVEVIAHYRAVSK